LNQALRGKGFTGQHLLPYNLRMKKFAQHVINLFLSGLLLTCLGLWPWSQGLAANSSKKPTEKFTLIIHGVKGKALENIKNRLISKQNSLSPEQTDLARWRYYLEASREIKNALKPYGYFKAKVKTHLERDDNHWRITAEIDLGHRLTFTTIDVQVTGPGANDPSFTRYLAHLPIKPGSPFNSERYEQIKDRLQDIANTQGYFKAKLTHSELRIDLERNETAVTLVLNTGPRYHFGETQFSPSPLDTSLLKSYLEYSPNTPYLNKKLEKSRSNLSGSNYFQQVTMTPDVKHAHDFLVPIKTKLTPQDQVVYSLGAGYGTTTGPRALASMDLRWLNRYGHSLKTLARISQFNSTIEGIYTIPGRHPATQYYTISAGVSELNQSTGTGKNLRSSFAYHTHLAKWRFITALNFLIEKYDLKNYPRFGSSFVNDTSLLYPSVSLQRTEAKKNILNPDYGYNVSLVASAGSRYLASRTSFAQFLLNTEYLYTLPTHTRLLPRASFGYTYIDDLKNLPLSMQFYTGAYNSVRGFLFNQIGPGRALAVGSFEAQQRIWKNIYGAGFIDAGLVTDTQPHNSNDIIKPFRNQKFNVGAGPGLVYLSPIGAIEVSVAKVLDADQQLAGRIGKWVVQFGIGVLL